MKVHAHTHTHTMAQTKGRLARCPRTARRPSGEGHTGQPREEPARRPPLLPPTGQMGAGGRCADPSPTGSHCLRPIGQLHGKGPSVLSDLARHPFSTQELGEGPPVGVGGQGSMEMTWTKVSGCWVPAGPLNTPSWESGFCSLGELGLTLPHSPPSLRAMHRLQEVACSARGQPLCTAALLEGCSELHGPLPGPGAGPFASEDHLGVFLRKTRHPGFQFHPTLSHHPGPWTVTGCPFSMGGWRAEPR